MNSTRFTNPAAVILAAGRSSRMGATKPLMLIDDMPMLMYAANAFRAAGIDYIIVVTGFDAERVAALAREGALHPVHNSNFDKGMFTSVCAGIEAVPDEFDSAFVLPVDIPFVSPETLKRLQTSANREHGASAKERGAPSAGGIDGMPAAARSRPIVIPRHTGKPGHPPLIHRSIFGQLRGRFFDPKQMESVLWRNGNHAQDYHYIPEPDLGILHISRDEIRVYSGSDVK